MQLLEKKIVNITKEIIDQNGLLLIDFLFRGFQNSTVIEVYIDGEKSVSVEDCAKISREINEKIEAENLFESAYRLEVSSPGVEKPLKFLQQFTKHINRSFDLQLAEEQGTIKKVTGKLLSIDGENMVFLIQKEEVTVPFNTIKKAKVIISFS
ncbi:MAG: ribosome maturation factor RimP [Ignavibacteriaceae bacterium]|jgi:ribosome maturation factor RimP|nr:ribosome maturation factor RimP [Ignavibacteriaceae bacterium]